MERFFKLTTLVFFMACFANSAYAQFEEQLTNAILKYYDKHSFQHCILYFDGKWYFVTAINTDYDYNNLAYYDILGNKKNINVKPKARESNIEFFFRVRSKKYSKYTFFPEDMTNVPDVVEAYNILKENKSKYYDIPQIGNVRVSRSGELFLFAKAISNDPNTSSPKNTGNTIVGDTKKSPNTITGTNSVQKKGNNDAVNSNTTQDTKSVTLVVYGIANNEDEAIKVALRSAIEQAFGTFVSANTQIVNDELTKDEIVSVTSGNIENYSLISSKNDTDGKHSVTVKATVSIGKLIQFAQSKGATTELAGAAFAINMKMRRLNKENEYQALCHMLDEMLKISELNLFDYSIETETPQIVKGKQSLYGIPTKISVTPNENYTNLVNEFRTTIKAISLSEQEQEEYTKTKDKFFSFGSHYSGYKEYKIQDFPRFSLRNNIYESDTIKIKLEELKKNIWKSSMSFKINDNLGNSSVPVCVHYKGLSTQKVFNIGCDWPIWIDDKGSKFNDVKIDIYGITSSNNSYDKNFMGSSQGFLYNTNGICIKKDMYGTYRDMTNYSWGFYDIYYHTISVSGQGENHIGIQSCLDLSGKTFPFAIYLFYKEQDIEKLSSITVSPVSPSEFVYKQLTLN